MRDKLAKGGSDYRGGMLVALFRLLIIASLLTMPLAMLSTPATAAEHPASRVAMPCDGHERPAEAPSDAKPHCTSCVAIAQPSAAPPATGVQPIPVLVDRDVPIMIGLPPEVATPPPKPV